MNEVDVARVLAVRDRILADPDFREDGSWLETWVLPALRRAVDWFTDLAPGAHVAVLICLSVALAALCAHLVLLLIRTDGAAIEHSSGHRAQSTVAAVPRHPGALAGAARQAVDRGDFDDAVRLTWLAALARLDAAGVSPAWEGRADWEHVADVQRAAPALSGPVGNLAGIFQRCRFGGAAADRSTAERSLALFASLSGVATRE